MGVLVFGPIMEAVGARWAFRICSIFALTTCIVYATAQNFMPPVELIREEKKYETNNANNNENINIQMNTTEKDNDDVERLMTEDKSQRLSCATYVGTP